MPNVIISCDFSNKKELTIFLSKFGQEALFLKLGMQLIYAEGFQIINELKDLGHKIFLDLKLHDIPNTTKNAIKSLAKYKPDFLTVHMATLISNTKIEDYGINLVFVTILTSINEVDYKTYFSTNVNLKNAISNQIDYSKNNLSHYYVCSVHEASNIKKIDPKATLFCPGIRTKCDELNDQIRVMTPAKAKKLNIDYIIVGRPIIHNPDPYKKYHAILEEFNNE